MIGFGLTVHGVAGKLIVTDPVNPVLVVLAILFTLLPLFVEASRRPLRRVRLALWCVAGITAVGLATSACRLVLDRPAGTATVSDLAFFHWTSRTMPIDQLQGASIETGSTTSAVVLNYADGHVSHMSSLNQTGGKQHAVTAINDYLQADRATHR
jgi:hypothetical protein